MTICLCFDEQLVYHPVLYFVDDPPMQSAHGAIRIFLRYTLPRYKHHECLCEYQCLSASGTLLTFQSILFSSGNSLKSLTDGLGLLLTRIPPKTTARASNSLENNTRSFWRSIYLSHYHRERFTPIYLSGDQQGQSATEIRPRPPIEDLSTVCSSSQEKQKKSPRGL
jgi:hypothetical protein